MRAWFLLLTIVALAAIPAAAQQPTTTTEKPAVVKAEKPSVPAAALVNLNTATQAQLESLPGVGPKLAERILDYRQKNSQFKKLEDLMNVQGIGEKNFLKLKPLLTVTEKAVPSGAQSR
jgi:competence protein ComEA